MLIQPAYRDDLRLQGEYELIRVDYAKELGLAARHPLAERASILAELAPCIGVEHRHGVCPCGLRHDMKRMAGKNTIVDALRQSIVNQFSNVSATSLIVTEIATGTSNAATTSGMTQLTVEFYRAAPSSVVAGSPVTTQVIAYWFFGTSVANAGSNLQEWGIMAGGATATPGSGTMIARFLQAFAKNSLTTASGQYTLNIS